MAKARIAVGIAIGDHAYMLKPIIDKNGKEDYAIVKIVERLLLEKK